MSELNQLAALIQREREAIVARWRQQVRELPSARNLDVATLNDHIPGLLDELSEALQANSDQSIPEALADGSPPIHGLQRLKDAFDIEEVVAEYHVLRGCIHHLADENGVNLQGRPIHIINRVFDHSIGLALKSYATEQALEVQQRREDYLAFVAHDLRTPLFAISLAERVLQETLSTEGISTTSAKMLGALCRNVKQLEQLVAKVLEENANLQTEAGMKLVRRELDLWFLVESLTYELHPVAGSAGTELSNQVPEDLLAFADAGLLRRLFQNLIANAIKYTPGGRIVIGALDLPEDGVVECWVSDDGAGIPREFLEKIFEKGESDPEDAGGTGLGLTIVKTVVEAHGGKVTAESVEGVGSTFRFTLPHRVRPATV
jgi:signal transduction histidine kinase